MNLLKTVRRPDGKVALGNWSFEAPGAEAMLLGVRAEELDIVEPAPPSTPP